MSLIIFLFDVALTCERFTVATIVTFKPFSVVFAHKISGQALAQGRLLMEPVFFCS